MQKITGLGILSIGKFLGILYGMLGLIIGVIYGGILVLFSLLAAGGSSGQQAGGIAAFGVVGGIAVVVGAPIFYGLVGFIGGLIMAIIANLALRLSGGIELQLDP